MSSKSIGSKFEDFVSRTRLVFRMATMPSRKEMMQLLKIIALMIVALGIVGFVIRILIQSFIRVLGG